MTRDWARFPGVVEGLGGVDGDGGVLEVGSSDLSPAQGPGVVLTVDVGVGPDGFQRMGPFDLYGEFGDERLKDFFNTILVEKLIETV